MVTLNALSRSFCLTDGVFMRYSMGTIWKTMLSTYNIVTDKHNVRSIVPAVQYLRSVIEDEPH